MDDFYKVMPREIFPKDMKGDAPYTREELARKFSVRQCYIVLYWFNVTV
jgi:hypothetical protein